MYSLNSLQIPINSRSDSIHSYSLELFPSPLPLETDKLRFFGRIRGKEVERGKGEAIAMAWNTIIFLTVGCRDASSVVIEGQAIVSSLF